MFNIGDIIIYGAQGICKIDRFETKQIGRQTANYYVLKPLYNENTAVFVPVGNETLVAKMQSVLSKTQAKNLIEKAQHIGVIETKDENKKRDEYKSVLASGDRERLIAVIKTIRFERDIRRESGKKLNINDEQTLTKAELLLYNELSFVLGRTPDEIQSIMKFGQSGDGSPIDKLKDL